MAAQLGPESTLTRQPNIITCAIITWTAAAVLVSLRFYTRARISRALGWEDWVILAALVNSAAMTGNVLYSVHSGLGLPPEKVSLTRLRDLRLGGWLFLYFYMIALYLTKISALLLYFRILTHHKYRIAVYFLTAVVMACFIFSFIVPLIFVTPLEAAWETRPEIAAIAKYRPEELVITASALHLATDALLLLLPFPVIFTLNISYRQRAILLVLFSLGFLVSIASFLRLYYSIIGSSDSTWNVVNAVYLTCLEVNLAIICCCLMTLKPLVANLFPKLLSLASGPGATGSLHAGGGGRSMPTIGSGTPRRQGFSWTLGQEGDSGDDLILEEADRGGMKLGTLADIHQVTRPGASSTATTKSNGRG